MSNFKSDGTAANGQVSISELLLGRWNSNIEALPSQHPHISKPSPHLHTLHRSQNHVWWHSNIMLWAIVTFFLLNLWAFEIVTLILYLPEIFLLTSFMKVNHKGIFRASLISLLWIQETFDDFNDFSLCDFYKTFYF